MHAVSAKAKPHTNNTKYSINGFGLIADSQQTCV